VGQSNGEERRSEGNDQKKTIVLLFAKIMVNESNIRHMTNARTAKQLPSPLLTNALTHRSSLAPKPQPMI